MYVLTPISVVLLFSADQNQVSLNNHSLWVYEVDGQYIVPTKVDVRLSLSLN